MKLLEPQDANEKAIVIASMSFGFSLSRSVEDSTKLTVWNGLIAVSTIKLTQDSGILYQPIDNQIYRFDFYFQMISLKLKKLAKEERLRDEQHHMAYQLLRKQMRKK